MRKAWKNTFAPHSSSARNAVRAETMAAVEAPTVNRGRLHSSHRRLIRTSDTKLPHRRMNLESGEKFIGYRLLL